MKEIVAEKTEIESADQLYLFESSFGNKTLLHSPNVAHFLETTPYKPIYLYSLVVSSKQPFDKNRG